MSATALVFKALAKSLRTYHVAISKANASYFGECGRDEAGHCKPSGQGGDRSRSSTSSAGKPSDKANAEWQDMYATALNEKLDHLTEQDLADANTDLEVDTDGAGRIIYNTDTGTFEAWSIEDIDDEYGEDAFSRQNPRTGQWETNNQEGFDEADQQAEEKLSGYSDNADPTWQETYADALNHDPESVTDDQLREVNQDISEDTDGGAQVVYNPETEMFEAWLIEDVEAQFGEGASSRLNPKTGEWETGVFAPKVQKSMPSRLTKAVATGNQCSGGECACACKPLPKNRHEAKTLVREAGKAVACLLLGLELHNLTIQPKPSASWSWHRGRDEQKAIQVHLAGDLAEALLLGRKPNLNVAPGNDRFKALSIGTPKGWPAYKRVAEQEPKIRKLLSERTTWGAVVCLAGHLAHKGSLTGNEVRDYFECIRKSPLVR